jgi:hypothetical protein
MTSKISVRVWLLFITLVVLLALPTVALARGLAQEAPPVTGPGVAVVVIDVAFLAAITAFIKKQFELQGKTVMAVAFGVGVIIWGAPLLSQAFPVAGTYIDSFMAFLKLWIGAMGSTDLFTDIGSKIASVKPTKTVEAATK